MKTPQTRIDAIREEFQDARPDVVMLIDELKEEDNAKNLTENPDNGKYYGYTPTEAEIEAAAASLADSCGKIFKWEYMDNDEKALFLEQAKVVLEAAAKVRGKESPLP